jgi:thiamine biosynthesis protein ThiS
MIINGKNMVLDSNICLSDLLLKEGFDRSLVAVMVNDEIVSSESFDGKYVTDLDRVEVVLFVGGGCK